MKAPRFLVALVVAVVLIGLGWLGYVLFLLRPTNDRDWEFGMQTLTLVSIQGETVHAQHVRDFRYTADGVSSTNYVDRSFDVGRISQVWFVIEPFTVPPFNNFDGVAHTYFVFDFDDQAPVAITVEARRARGQTFDVVRGLLNQYELIYIWGNEQDITGRRALIEKHALYMYPLTIPGEAARALFLQLAQTTAQLDVQPRFYNSLTSNCTNELAKAANAVQPGAIPPNIALVLPGYSDRVLYDLHFIPTDAPIAELRQRYSIADLVIAAYDQPDFSTRIRAEITQRSAWPAGARAARASSGW